MKLSTDYLNQRYLYWKLRIHEANIWKAGNFGKVSIVVRPPSKSYNGMFIRRFLNVNGRRQLVDRIFIYDRPTAFDTKFLDSILVHEMIHQYIVQNKIKDSSTHGKVFRLFMQRINEKFPDELKIHIRDTNPSLPKIGEGNTNHKLLLLQLENRTCFCAVINPTKIDFFNQMIAKEAKNLKIRNYSWGESNDIYFNRFRRCTRSLHGIKKSSPQMIEFCSQFNIKIFNPFL